MFRQYGVIVARHPWKIIAAVVVFSAIVLFGASYSRFVSDYDSTLPDRSPLTAQIHAIQTRFESRSTLAFLVSGGQTNDRMRATCAMSAALERTPGVAPGRVYGLGSDALRYVVGDNDQMEVRGLGEFCSSNQPLTEEILAGLGPMRNLIQASNGDYVIYADLDVISGLFQPILESIDREIDLITSDGGVSGVRISYSGQPAFIAQNDRFSKRIALFFPLIMLMVLLLHWEALRSVQAVLIPIFTGLVATALAIGVYGWLRLPLDTYAVIAPILILAVGAGHSVQLLKRYMEELRERVAEGARPTRDQNETALVATLAAMGPVLTLAVTGAAACLFALLLLDVAALARFGLLVGTGICGALLLELTLVPAIRILLPRPTVLASFGELSGFWQNNLRRIGNAALTGPRLLIGLALVALTGLLVFGLLQVRLSHSISVYTASDVPVQRTLDELVDAGAGPYVFDVMIDTQANDGAFAPDALGAARAFQERLDADPSVRATLSAASIIDFLQCRFGAAANCATSPVRSSEEAQQVWTVLFGGGREAGLIDDTGRYLRVRAFVDSDETQVAERLIRIAEETAASHDVSIVTGGSAVAAKALADGIVRVSLEKAALLLVIVALIGGLAFRSVKMALLFAIPSAVTILANFAYLGWSGTTLNVATAAVATIAVGVGLDYLIYIAFRVREGVARGQTLDDAIRQGHMSAGGAALCVAMAVSAGYLVLLLSPGYLLHHWLAVLVPMTMVFSLFGALFLFPFLLRIFRPSLDQRRAPQV